jgi:hypothetical protein
MRPNKSTILFAAMFALSARGDLLDRVNDALSIRNEKAEFQLQISGLLDFETYYWNHAAPGLIYADNEFLFNPRLSIFADVQWTKHFYFFAQARIDRGFDPSNENVDARLDEYMLRYTPFDSRAINVQIGKFATVVGNWVPRHLSWDNPFINAPLPYENLTGVWDEEAPEEVDDFLYWAHTPTDEYGMKFSNYEDKEMRLPLIWGPSYTTGAAILGTIEWFDYAAEIKNAALSSPPDYWDATDRGFSHPTFSGRIGARPNEMLNFGVSASGGAYFDEDAADSLPKGRGIGDYRELLLGQDASFAWHHLQLWAEVFETRFEIPRIGNADTLSYYIEGKYKITTQLFAALRWNQQFYSTVRDEGDERAKWGNDTWRVDAAVGYRFTNYLQGKLQYSFTNEEFERDNHLFAAQVTLKF